MTNERLYTVHADGRVETVAVILEFCPDDEAGREEYYANNRAFEEEKARRGF